MASELPMESISQTLEYLQNCGETDLMHKLYSDWSQLVKQEDININIDLRGKFDSWFLKCYKSCEENGNRFQEEKLLLFRQKNDQSLYDELIEQLKRAIDEHTEFPDKMKLRHVLSQLEETPVNEWIIRAHLCVKEEKKLLCNLNKERADKLYISSKKPCEIKFEEASKKKKELQEKLDHLEKLVEQYQQSQQEHNERVSVMHNTSLVMQGLQDLAGGERNANGLQVRNHQQEEAVQKSGRELNKKFDAFKKVVQETYNKFQAVFMSLEELVESLLKEVQHWQEQLKLDYVELKATVDLESFAPWCAQTGLLFHEIVFTELPRLEHAIGSVSGLGSGDNSISISCCDELNKQFKILLNRFYQRTFVVTEQESWCVKKKDKTQVPKVTLRILGADGLNVLGGATVKAYFVLEDSIMEDCFFERDDHLHLDVRRVKGQKLRNDTEKFLKMKKGQRYEAKFCNILLTFDRGTRQKLVHEEKYRLLFHTKINQDEFWTLSLPMVVTTGANQNCQCLASVMWQCFSTDVIFPEWLFGCPQTVGDAVTAFCKEFRDIPNAELKQMEEEMEVLQENTGSSFATVSPFKPILEGLKYRQSSSKSGHTAEIWQSPIDASLSVFLLLLQFAVPIQTRNELPWSQVATMLNTKMIKLSERELTTENLLHLRHRIPDLIKSEDSDPMVSLTQFCVDKLDKEPIKDGDEEKCPFSFWKWFLAVYNLIERYLLKYWENGWIEGFICKADAERKLKDSPRSRSAMFLLRFSDSHITDSQGLKSVFGLVTAAVLMVKKTKDNQKAKTVHHLDIAGHNKLKDKPLANILLGTDDTKHQKVYQYLYPDLTSSEQIFRPFSSSDPVVPGYTGVIDNFIVDLEQALQKLEITGKRLSSSSSGSEDKDGFPDMKSPSLAGSKKVKRDSTETKPSCKQMPNTPPTYGSSGSDNPFPVLQNVPMTPPSNCPTLRNLLTKPSTQQPVSVTPSQVFHNYPDSQGYTASSESHGPIQTGLLPTFVSDMSSASKQNVQGSQSASCSQLNPSSATLTSQHGGVASDSNARFMQYNSQAQGPQAELIQAHDETFIRMLQGENISNQHQFSFFQNPHANMAETTGNPQDCFPDNTGLFQAPSEQYDPNIQQLDPVYEDFIVNYVIQHIFPKLPLIEKEKLLVQLQDGVTPQNDTKQCQVQSPTSEDMVTSSSSGLLPINQFQFEAGMESDSGQIAQNIGLFDNLEDIQQY